MPLRHTGRPSALPKCSVGTTFVKLGPAPQPARGRPALRCATGPGQPSGAVAPFSSGTGCQEGQAALGRQQQASRFDMPGAGTAASIAQIHRAALPDGTEVVVKDPPP